MPNDFVLWCDLDSSSDRLTLGTPLRGGVMITVLDDERDEQAAVVIGNATKLRRLIDTLLEYEQEMLHAEARGENSEG